MIHRAFLTVLAGFLSCVGLGAEDRKIPSTKDCRDFVFLSESRPLLLRCHLEVDGQPLDAAWGAFISRVFEQLDTGKAGFLGKEGVAKLPPAHYLFGQPFRNSPLPSFSLLDANRDDKVSRDELARYFRNNGGGPFRFDAPNFSRYDYAAALLAERLIADDLVLGGGRRAPNAETLNKAFFKHLDTNKDGKLSREELAAAPALLAKLDADDDEMISAMEILGDMRPQRADEQYLEVYFRSGKIGFPAAPLLMVEPGRPSVDLARRLQAQYAPKGEKTPRNTLTQKDLGLDKAAFAQLDADDNGELDIEELARFTHRPADLELHVRFGASKTHRPAIEVRSPTGEATSIAKKITTTKEGHVVVLLGKVRLVLQRHNAPPGPQVLANARRLFQEQFRNYDQDANGYLDRNEVRGTPLQPIFHLLDQDGNGKLFEKETLASIEPLLVLQAQAAASSAALSFAEEGKGLFDLLDTDRDGRLSIRELRQFTRLLDQLDQDGDGLLSLDEIPRGYSMVFSQAVTASAGLYAFYDIDDLILTRGSRRPERKEGPLWFRKMDKNRDGDLSRREFIGTDADFRRLDLDGDGLISVDEALQAKELFNGKGKNP